MNQDVAGLFKNKIRINQISELKSFQTRSGERLCFREYPVWSDTLILSIHGVGGDSRYMSMLAHRLAQQELGYGVTLDLRSHGGNFQGEVAQELRPSQIIQDIEEFLIFWKFHHGVKKIWLLGHSLGGAVAITLAKHLSQHFEIEKLILVSPFLGFEKNVLTKDSSLWIERAPTAWILNYPPSLRQGKEVIKYPISFIHACCQFDMTDLAEIASAKSVILLASPTDQICDWSMYVQIGQDAPSLKLIQVPNTDHLGLVMSPLGIQSIQSAIQK